jgi:hypothetical protein
MRSAQNTVAPSKASLLLMSIAACAAMDSELAAARESWRGATYDQVVAAWGPPARSARDSHTWVSEDRVPQAQRSGGGTGGVIFGAPEGAAAICERTLVVQNARVVREGEWTGKPEFCKRFARRQ